MDSPIWMVLIQAKAFSMQPWSESMATGPFESMSRAVSAESVGMMIVGIVGIVGIVEIAEIVGNAGIVEIVEIAGIAGIEKVVAQSAIWKNSSPSPVASPTKPSRRENPCICGVSSTAMSAAWSTW